MISELADEYLARFTEDAARTLEQQPLAHVAALMDELPAERGSHLLANLLPHAARHCLLHMSAGRAAELLEELPHIHAARLLALVPRDRHKEVLATMRSQRRQMLMHSTLFPEDSVGSVLIPATPCTRVGATLSDVRHSLATDESEPIPVITVLDGENRVEGLLSAIDLFKYDGDTDVVDIMRIPPVRLNARADLSSVVRLRAWLSEDYLPVTDVTHVFIGMLAKSAVYQFLLVESRFGADNEGLSATLVSLAELMWRPGADLLTGMAHPDGESE
ncbi:MAG: hypothetical protein H6978_01890 [Gammaproteobacteria bacterium]|nr:hypothetical protein [Gammaproteobacteria bacterium]